MKEKVILSHMKYMATEHHTDHTIAGPARLIVRDSSTEEIAKTHRRLVIVGAMLIDNEQVTHDDFNELWECDVYIVPKNKYTENLSRKDIEEIDPLGNTIGGMSVGEVFPEAIGKLYEFTHFKNGSPVPLQRTEEYLNAKRENDSIE